MYRLIRDDGYSLLLDGSAWEGALELAFLYGWKPAGTEAPRSGAWLSRRSEPAARPWDGQDYFSCQLQRVGSDDARSLSRAVLRALVQIPDAKESHDAAERSPHTAEALAGSAIPSRASVVAGGVSAPKRKAMKRFAVFAGRGGFTIGCRA